MNAETLSASRSRTSPCTDEYFMVCSWRRVRFAIKWNKVFNYIAYRSTNEWSMCSCCGGVRVVVMVDVFEKKRGSNRECFFIVSLCVLVE